MRLVIIGYGTLLAAILCGTTTCAQQEKTTKPQGGKTAPGQKRIKYDAENGWQFSLLTGYRQENLHWSIAGNSYGQDPNVYSELIWKKLSGTVLHASLLWQAHKRWRFRAEGNRAVITRGSVTDTDYRDDNRANASYRQQFGSDKGYTASWLAGAGYALLPESRFSITPYIGYAASYQNVYLVDPVAMLGLLNSSYKTQWYGPFVRVESVLQLTRKLDFIAGILYSQLNYHAQANWNLISTFNHPLSFRHEAKGYSIDINGELRYKLSRAARINVLAGYFNRQTGTGIDQLYLASGQTDKTRLNGVGSDGFSVMAGLGISLRSRK